MPVHRGVTIVELLIVLTIVGIMVSLASPLVRSPGVPRQVDLASTVERARRRAISSGRAERPTFGVPGDKVRVLALPDGRVVVDSAVTIHVEPPERQ